MTAAFVLLCSHLLSLMRDVEEEDYTPDMFNTEAQRAYENLDTLLELMRKKARCGKNSSNS